MDNTGGEEIARGMSHRTTTNLLRTRFLELMSHRSAIRTFVVFTSLLLVASCSKEPAPSFGHTDSSSTTTTAPQQAASTAAPSSPYDTMPIPALPSPETIAGSDQNAAQSQQGSVHILDDSDPIAKQLVESMKHPGQPMTPIDPAPNMPTKLIDPRRLAEFIPSIPGYQLYGQPSLYQSRYFSKASAVLRNQFDSSRKIQVLIVDENETQSAPFAQQIQSLRQKGSLTSYPNGEPVTAYYVQVNSAPAAKAYVPMSHLGTISVLVSGHRMMQLRESRVSDADHITEVAKYFDVQKFADEKK